MRLRRPDPRRGAISLVPLVDVLLILLVFFMVTSRYENLGMIPVITAQADASGPGTSDATEAGQARTILLRLGPDGVVRAPGRPEELAPPHLDAYLRERKGDRVRVLASPEARSQALVALADSAARAGVADLRLVRIEERR